MNFQSWTARNYAISVEQARASFPISCKNLDSIFFIFFFYISARVWCSFPLLRERRGVQRRVAQAMTNCTGSACRMFCRAPRKHRIFQHALVPRALLSIKRVFRNKRVSSSYESVCFICEIIWESVVRAILNLNDDWTSACETCVLLSKLKMLQIIIISTAPFAILSAHSSLVCTRCYLANS